MKRSETKKAVKDFKDSGRRTMRRAAEVLGKETGAALTKREMGDAVRMMLGKESGAALSEKELASLGLRVDPLKKMQNGGEIMKKGSNKAISVDDYERQSGFKKKKLPLDNKAISVDDYERQTPRGLPKAKSPATKTATPTPSRRKMTGTRVMRNKGGTIKKPGGMNKGGTIKKPSGMKKGGAVKMKKPSSKNSGLYGR